MNANLFMNKYKHTKVLSNLISNGIKFSPEGGSVKVGLEKVGEVAGKHIVRYTVTDSGPGVEPEVPFRDDALSGMFF